MAKPKSKPRTTKHPTSRLESWMYKAQKGAEFTLMVIEVWGSLKGKKGAETFNPFE